MINFYAPTEDKHDDIKTAFYDELEILYDSLPKIVLGDFNAKIGKETMYRPTIGKESLHRETNENGSMLVTFASNRNMVVSSTMFPHKNIHKQTWMSSCGRIGNQIEHVLVDNRIRSNIIDLRSMRGSSALSHHFLVRVKIHFRISVEKQRRNSIKKRIKRDILKTNVVKLYQDRLNEELRGINQETDINNTWEKVVQVINDTSERILRNTQSGKNKIWFDENCKKALEIRDKVRLKVIQNPSNENKKTLASKQREAKKQ